MKIIKSKIIFFAIFILIFLGIAIYGYFKAVPGVQNNRENKPEIEITPDFFDFNDVEYGKIAQYTFKVRNSGKEILKITKVATSCACTTAQIEKEAINPGQEVSLFVEYNTGLMTGAHAKGEQERIIYVKSNDPVNPQAEVRIYADVK